MTLDFANEGYDYVIDNYTYLLEWIWTKLKQCYNLTGLKTSLKKLNLKKYAK